MRQPVRMGKSNTRTWCLASCHGQSIDLITQAMASISRRSCVCVMVSVCVHTDISERLTPWPVGDHGRLNANMIILKMAEENAPAAGTFQLTFGRRSLGAIVIMTRLAKTKYLARNTTCDRRCWKRRRLLYFWDSKSWILRQYGTIKWARAVSAMDWHYKSTLCHSIKSVMASASSSVNHASRKGLLTDND